MENEKRLGSLEDLTKESFLNRPNQAPEAVEEYLKNLAEENNHKAEQLQKNLEDKEYFEQFKVAITHTSLILFLISMKASNEVSVDTQSLSEVERVIRTTKIDLDKYIREFLLFARKDDKPIYEMRMFYLNELTGEEWAGMEEMEVEGETEEDLKEKAVLKNKIERYDSLLNDFKKQYKESKIHLA